MDDKETIMSRRSKIIILKIDSGRLAGIKEKSQEHEKSVEKQKKRRRKSVSGAQSYFRLARSNTAINQGCGEVANLVKTRTEQPDTDTPQRKKVGRPRKSSTIKRSKSAEAVESTGASEAAVIDDAIKAKEIEKTDAEVRTANRESQAYLVNKHMIRWGKMAQEPANPKDTETVLVKLSNYTCAVAVPVPMIPTHVSPSVQALVAKSHYTMREVDEAFRQRDQLLKRTTIEDQILLEKPPRLNFHGHPSPPVSYSEPASFIQHAQPVQPLPHLLTSGYPRNPQDPNYYLAVATRDHALRPRSKRDLSMDIDLKMAHLRNLRALNLQYSHAPQSAEVLKAARSVAHIQDANTTYEMPPALRPPQRQKILPLYDRLLSEMKVVSDKLHYRRRVRNEYRRHIAVVCVEAAKDDVQTRGPFVVEEKDTGAFVTTLPTDGEIIPARDKVLKLGYRRRSARTLPAGQVCGPSTNDYELSMTGEEWRRVIENKGASLTPRQRRKLGFDILEDQEMDRATVNELMSVGDAFDVDRDVEMLQNNFRRRPNHQGRSALFRGYVR